MKNTHSPNSALQMAKARTGQTMTAIFAIMALSACASAAPSVQNTAHTVMTMLPGTYSNIAQYDAAPETHQVEPQIGSDAPWIDHQHAEFKPVSVPAIEGDVIALQWRRGGPEGAISRQRLWAFRDTGASTVMDFYTLRSEIDFADEAAFANLQADDLIAYGDICALPVRQMGARYEMAIPETCTIVSRSGRDMTLSAEITISADQLTYVESGRLSTGALVFQVPGTGPYQFVRVTE